MSTHEEALIHQVEGSEYVPYPFDISPEEIATAFDETAMSEADVLQSIVDAMNVTIGTIGDRHAGSGHTITRQ